MKIKTIITTLLIFATVTISAQETKKIKELDYAGIKISVPNNCEAKSVYELMNCNNTDVQWIYFDEGKLKLISTKVLNQYSNLPFLEKESDFKLKSFNAELTGKKFKLNSKGKISYRIIVSGTVNNQPLILNIGTDNDINTNQDLNDFLAKIISIE